MKKIGEFLKDTGKRLVSWFFMTFGIIVLWGYIIDFIKTHSVGNLHGRVGYFILMVFSAIGTPIHECAHWLGCKLFGFRVYDVALFRPRGALYDGVLGYVSFSYEYDNVLDLLGCTVTAMAPILIGVPIMFLIIRIAFPEAYKEIGECAEKAAKKGKKSWLSFLGSFAKGYYYGLFDLKGWGVLRGILVTYALISISMHMTLSLADIKVALLGMWVIALAYLIFAIVTAILKKEYKTSVLKVGSFISGIMSVGVFFNLIMFVISLIL